MKIWFYPDAKGRQQSATDDQLASLAARGAITPATLVWTDDMDNWATASQALPHLFASAPSQLRPAGPPSMPTIPVPKTARRSHELDYEILGSEMQIVEVELDPGETVVAEAGALCYMEQDINFETKLGDGSEPAGGFFGAMKNIGKRVLTGESIFMTHFTHVGSAAKRRVAFAAPYPGKIVPMHLAELGAEILCEKDAFLCAAFGTSIGIAFTRRLGTGFFGGEGFILQRLKGDGLAFIHAGGTIVQRELRGETLRVDTGCLVAMTSGITYDIQRAGNLKSMFFGGEGLFLATLSGQGTVWLQSLPFSRMADRIIAHAPSSGGSARGEGSVLGGLGRMLDGE